MASIHIVPFFISLREFSRCVCAVVNFNDDGGIWSIRSQHEAPAMAHPGSDSRMTSPCDGLPANSPVELELHHVVVHLVVTESRKIHIHDEDIADARNQFIALRSAKHPRAVEMGVRFRIAQDPEDLRHRSRDPSGNFHRRRRFTIQVDLLKFYGPEILFRKLNRSRVGIESWISPVYPYAGRVSASASRGTERVIPSPILKDGHNWSVGQFLDSVADNVDVLRSVFHLDEKLGSVGFDTMLQGATIENRVPGVPLEDASPAE